MTTKAKWQAMHDELLAGERRRLGPPPTDDEILDYERGELSAEQTERVRALLVAYPELAQAISAPFPTDDAQPGDPGYLSEADVSRHWAEFQRRNRRGRVLPFRKLATAAFAAAAMVAVIFGAMLWQARAERGRPVDEVVWEQRDLLPGGRRGGGEEFVPLTSRAEKVAITLQMMPQPQFAGYRLELLDVSGAEPRLVYDTTAVTVTDDMTVLVIVRPKSLKAGGKYQFVVYGVDGGRDEKLDTYSFRIPR
jgi:hypothetical protein